MFVHPVIENPGDHILGVIPELVVHGNVGIAGEVRTFPADLLIGPQILGRKLLVVLHGVGPQQQAARVVEGHAPGNVAVFGEKCDHRAHLRLRGGIGAGAALFTFLPPLDGEIAVEIDALFATLHAEGDPVVILQAAFGQQAVVRSPGLIRFPGDQQPRLLRMGLPRAVGIGHTDAQNAPVSVDILRDKALDRVLIVGIGARAGADDLRRIGQRPFGAVGVDAQADVEGPGVHTARDVRVLPIPGDEGMKEIQAGAGG